MKALRLRKQPSAFERWLTSWLNFWEGVAIYHFFGIRVALIYFAAWTGLNLCIRLGVWIGKNS